jgi:hypothetical protein
MVAIKRAIEPYEREKAKERQKEHGNTAPGKNKEGNTSENFSTMKDRALDTIASFVGVSRLILKKAEEIVDAVEQEPEKYQKKYGLLER